MLRRQGDVLTAAASLTGITWFMWMPMLAFEVTIAGWFIVKGVTPPFRHAIR